VGGAEKALINADEQRMHQVVTSLLDNVRIHTPVGTAVQIEIKDEGDTVVLEVSDNGPGIPESALGHIFDRFYRADPSRSRDSGGSGLGLSIVEAIVVAHGGTVVASNLDTGGALIRITLPRVSDI
jgi:two-component system OmpR family sensor kinase